MLPFSSDLTWLIMTPEQAIAFCIKQMTLEHCCLLLWEMYALPEDYGYMRLSAVFFHLHERLEHTDAAQ